MIEQCPGFQDPSRVFLETHSGAYITYGQIDERSGAFAAALAECGVQAGDRVAVQVDKSADVIALYLGCLRLGAIYIPLNTAYMAAELAYFLSDAEPRLLIGRPADLAILEPVVRDAPATRLETLGTEGEGSFADIARRKSSSDFSPFAGDADALAAILYTSGTTGRPKGAMLTRRNLLDNARALAEVWDFSKDDILLHALPLFHAHGLFIAINTMLVSGCRMIFLPKFEAEAIVALMPRATVLMGVPTFYTRLLQDPRLTRTQTRNMRLFISGSAPLLDETQRQFKERTGHGIIQRYGMTETLITTATPAKGDGGMNSVGRPLPGMELRITDVDSGNPVQGYDATGMIEVRGRLFPGYWRNPGKTAGETTSDGYWRTGDLGQLDSGGYLHVVGRAKDMVITGGYNVYPKEIETEIDQFPGITESAVIGVPHPDFGEGVTAIVTTGPDVTIDEAQIIKAISEKLAKYKLPKRIIVMDELPRNALGKVQKNVLRERFALLYGGPSA